MFLIFFDQIFSDVFGGVIFYFLGIQLCAQRTNNQKKTVNPMVWRCREFFFSKIFGFFNLFRPFLFRPFFGGGNVYVLGHFLFLGIELCAQRINNFKKILILWYGVAAISFFPRCSVFFNFCSTRCLFRILFFGRK